MPDGMQRATFEDGRIYYDESGFYPSVSTVLDQRPKPEQLRNYLKNTPEHEQKQTTFWTQNRGTLIHYHLLDQLIDEELWSEDEQNSEDCLRGKRDHSETGLTGDYETWQQFQDDLEWAEGTWDLIRDIYDIRPETTLDAELYVRNTDFGYAGQFDLLSSAPNGDVILRDIKTSKMVYDKHLLQLVAYKNAVPITVDSMEVIRINPDGQTWDVHSSDDWVVDEADLWDEFVGLREEMEQGIIDDLRDKIDL